MLPSLHIVFNLGNAVSSLLDFVRLLVLPFVLVGHFLDNPGSSIQASPDLHPCMIIVKGAGRMFPKGLCRCLAVVPPVFTLVIVFRLSCIELIHGSSGTDVGIVAGCCLCKLMAVARDVWTTRLLIRSPERRQELSDQMFCDFVRGSWAAQSFPKSPCNPQSNPQ